MRRECSKQSGVVVDILEYFCIGGSVVSILILLVSAAVYKIITRRRPYKPIVPLEEQSLVEPSPEKIHYSKIYKNGSGELLSYLYPNVRTLYEVFLNGGKASEFQANCIGWRGSDDLYVWQSYHVTLERMKNFGAGLISSGLPAGQSSILGIYLKNCPEWIMAEFAAFSYSMVVVALYDTLDDDAVKYIMNHTELAAVLCEDNEKAAHILDNVSPYLKLIVTLKEVKEETLDNAKRCGIEISTFEYVERRGANEKITPVAPKPEDIATICYTSGTTGVPKGVILTHANCVASVDSCFVHLGSDWIKKDDVTLSYLPLGHMLERFILYQFYREGASVGFFRGDLKRLGEDIAALRPTFLLSVPRVLYKIYDNYMDTVSKSWWKKTLFDYALSAKEAEMKRGIIRKNSIWDKLVFRDLQDSMGGRLRKITTASAPIAENVLTFIRCAIGCQVIEGYGQTECLVASTTLFGDTQPGHVGPPVPSCKIKLVDVPEMEYYAKDDIGELCVKGTNVFKGYYKDPEKTRETIDGDGWMHTGDIARWLPNGTLKIVDRKKHIFKLSLGEYIAPEKIESVYLRSPLVDQVLVHGESLKSCIVGIVVPNKGALVDWAVRKDIGGSLSFDDAMKREVLADMLQKGREAGLKSFEQVKDIFLHPELFSSQNGLLTPTMKTKRREIINKFKLQIDKMYKNLL